MGSKYDPEGVFVSDVSDLLVAIGTLVSALTGAFVLVWTSVVRPRQQEQAAAKKAANSVAARIVEALSDGEITREELDDIRRSLDDEEGM